MRLWIRLVMVVSIVTAFVASVLLLNITAPNPTHRRYSSESPIMKASPAEIGLSAEQILSHDLGVPRNDLPTERQCFCNGSASNTPGVNECRICAAHVQLTSQFRRPDFLTPEFIGESKNTQGLLYERRDFDQIGDFVLAARLMGRPLWVYVRVDTRVDTEYIEMVRSTGGDVVFYFVTPGYQDPIDRLAFSLLMISAGVFTVSFVLELGARSWARAQAQAVRSHPTPRKPPSHRVITPESASMRNARRMTEAAEEYLNRATDRTWTDIDRDTARGDRPAPTDDDVS